MKMLMRVLAILVISVGFSSAKYEGWQVWRVVPASNAHRTWLREIESNLGDVLDFWSSISKIPGESVNIMIPPRFQGTLSDVMNTIELPYKVFIGDVGQLIANQMLAIHERRDREPRSSSLANFDYNVYHPYDEIQQWVSDIATEYSDIVSPFLLDHSYEGRPINGFKIRGTGSQSENPTAVWFEGGIHAREWISPATVMGFTQKLLDDYRNGDTLAVNMLDNIDWYIVPSLNVDGYSYTWDQDRLWRKTRSPNQGSSCTGKDPNRNWAFEWGGPGTSPWPCSDKYHGPEPLSEPEVAAVTRFLRERKAQGQDFIVFIDWHSFSQKVIAPWSYKDVDTRTKDYDDQMAFARAVVDAINGVHGKEFTYGAGAEIMYAAAGSSKDFGYADFEPTGDDKNGGLGCKYSYTIELRDTGEYGQLLPEWQIQPSYEEIYAAVRAMGDHILRELGFIA
ncbi:carboxypeptidase B-like [Lytechinus variegatus]|uniref:carboxypeptidase B-like n=1 Tax=Lytechinus variegatus TaxID=7654 RepID=UPI001BB165CE|nr:carboxypeptidase B-like [Lytechinus variegatus]